MAETSKRGRTPPKINIAGRRTFQPSDHHQERVLAADPGSQYDQQFNADTLKQMRLVFVKKVYRKTRLTRLMARDTLPIVLPLVLSLPACIERGFGHGIGQ